MNNSLNPLAMVDHVAAKGGLQTCLIRAGLMVINPESDVNPTDMPEFKRYYRRLQRMTARGSASVYQVDEFCIKVLQCHPSEVYGDEWWDAIDDEMSMDYFDGEAVA